MDWILSVISMIVLILMGNKNKIAPIIGVIGQVLWIYYAIHLKQYGLLVGAILYTVVHARNAIKWNRKVKNIEKVNCVRKVIEKLERKRKYSRSVKSGTSSHMPCKDGFNRDVNCFDCQRQCEKFKEYLKSMEQQDDTSKV